MLNKLFWAFAIGTIFLASWAVIDGLSKLQYVR